MFSGIVQTAQKAKKIDHDGNSMRVQFAVPAGFRISAGDSICVDGVCSTVEKKTGSNFFVYYMPETLRKTTFGVISSSHTFNLEQSLTLQSLIGGHLVSGHVDTTSKLISVAAEQDAKVLKFSINKKFTKYIIYKGSIAVNGASLTVVSVDDDSFTVSLIPYTLEHTNLGRLKIEDKVNVEVDMIAKYLEKLQASFNQ